jgi:hypothetical protein
MCDGWRFYETADIDGDIAAAIPESNAVSEDLPASLPGSACSLQQAVGSEREHLLRAGPSISAPPPFCPVGLHEQAQSAPIGFLIGSVACSRAFHGDISQSPAKKLHSVQVRLSRSSSP